MPHTDSDEMVYNLMIKFGEKKYLEEMRTGILYCKTVAEFAKIEKSDVRYDPNEGISNKIEMNDGIIEFKPKNDLGAEWAKFKFKKGDFTNYYSGNVFCMSRFIIPTIENQYIDIHPDFEKFGDHYLIILNQPAFMERLETAIKREKYKSEAKMVSYTNLATHKGKRDIFLKDISHSWQLEYRIFFDIKIDKPLYFNIGDISDISLISKIPKDRKFRLEMTKISN